MPTVAHKNSSGVADMEKVDYIASALKPHARIKIEFFPLKISP